MSAPERAAFAGAFVCIALRDTAGRDEGFLSVETHGLRDGVAAMPYKAPLRRKPGVEVHVDMVAPKLPIVVVQKPIRRVDPRFQA